MSTFSFKLDPSSLPKLASRGDNYSEWRTAWQVAFRYAELWGIVSGTKTDNVPGASDGFAKEDNKAMVSAEDE